MRRSRTYDRSGAGTGIGIGTGTVGGTINLDENWSAMNASGYLSDHSHTNALPPRYTHRERRPRSATTIRPLIDTAESRFATYNRNLPTAPWAADDGDETPPTVLKIADVMHDDQEVSGMAGRYGHEARAPRLELMHEQHQLGYGSDGSETLSIHSTQSIPMSRRSIPITRRIPNGDSEQASIVLHQQEEQEQEQQLDGSMDDYLLEEGAISDSVTTKSSAGMAIKDRKKSLMTRLIPGRNAPLEAKRTGFQRSEEVGVPEGLSVPSDYMQASIIKQTSKESTDSAFGDNWGPVLSDCPLGSFVDNLGPGQVVGRQVLASPVLGEIQIGIAAGRAGIDVEIIRAKNLVVKPGVRVNPAPYVKVYLLEGKQCIAKAKTNAVRRTTAPLFQQHIVFSEAPRKKMLQITVMGDYGRMERKSFMGIAQIRLDDLELNPEPLSGWYKLYHSSSLVGTGPLRKDSESSLTDLRQ